MGRWIAGIAAAVVATVVAAVILANLNLGSPSIKVVAFSQPGSVRYGTLAVATVTVENEGKQTAENCAIHWKPGVRDALGLPLEVTAGNFAVQAGKQYTATLTSTQTYEFRGHTTSTASVTCNDTSDAGQQATIYVN